jgi:IS30 family transposase
VDTLVERSTRYVVWLHLPGGWKADGVVVAMRTAIRKLPNDLLRTITWDQGKERQNGLFFKRVAEISLTP